MLFSALQFIGTLNLRAEETPAANPAMAAAPAQNADRKEKGNGASAMALAASAMQQVMCMKMMADAARENDSEKMAMASMMCAQAAANAANAAQNKEGASKSTSPPQMAAMPTFEKSKIETEPKPDNFQIDAPENENRAVTTATTSNSPNIAGATPNAENGTVFNEDKNFKSNLNSLSLENAKPSGTSNIAVTEGSGTGSGLPSNNLGSLGTSGTNATASNGLSVQSNSSEDLKSDKNKKSVGKTNSGDASGFSSGGDASGLDDMMARMMGGNTSPGMFSAGAGGGLIDLAYGLQTPGKKMRNIFEFASDEYLKAKRNGAALNRKNPTAHSPSRALASQPSF
ncbi:hypothetical protein EBQ90_00485 [bacterium]|nr:hypothetical protein [bacterium]